MVPEATSTRITITKVDTRRKETSKTTIIKVTITKDRTMEEAAVAHSILQTLTIITITIMAGASIILILMEVAAESKETMKQFPLILALKRRLKLKNLKEQYSSMFVSILSKRTNSYLLKKE